MRTNLLVVMLLVISANLFAQNDNVWSNVPNAPDDRFTNPKKPLYAGPNGWWNFGEIRVQNQPQYSFKNGFNEISGDFVLANEKSLYSLFISFGTDNPPNGKYQVAAKGNVENHAVHLSFSDVSNQKIKEWTAKAGTLEITRYPGFLYFKARNILCEASGLHNKQDKPISLGFEGAIKLDD